MKTSVKFGEKMCKLDVKEKQKKFCELQLFRFIRNVRVDRRRKFYQAKWLFYYLLFHFINNYKIRYVHQLG